MNTNKNKKILQVCTVALEENGIARFLARAISAMDKSGLQIDIACFAPPAPAIQQQLQGHIGNFYLLPPRNSSPVAYVRALRSLVKQQNYSIVHAHGNSATLALEMCAAKWGGAPVRIAHSHSTQCMHTTVNKLLSPVFHRSYTHAMACSAPAAQWLFGGRPCTIVQNGADAGLFRYCRQQRQSVRRELGIPDNTLAVCAVAGFIPAKNHAFLLNAFSLLLKTRPESVLILVGQGPLQPQVCRQAQQMGIAHRVIFTGPRDDVPRLLCGMDVAVLPSIYEGLPAAALEYQCSGLPTLLSHVITKEAAPSPLARFLPLEQQAWADELAKISFESREEASAQAICCLQNMGLTREAMAAAMRSVYLQ